MSDTEHVQSITLAAPVGAKRQRGWNVICTCGGWLWTAGTRKDAESAARTMLHRDDDAKADLDRRRRAAQTDPTDPDRIRMVDVVEERPR